jgi:hypothetical protein
MPEPAALAGLRCLSATSASRRPDLMLCQWVTRSRSGRSGTISAGGASTSSCCNEPWPGSWVSASTPSRSGRTAVRDRYPGTTARSSGSSATTPNARSPATSAADPRPTSRRRGGPAAGRGRVDLPPPQDYQRHPGSARRVARARGSRGQAGRRTTSRPAATGRATYLRREIDAIISAQTTSGGPQGATSRPESFSLSGAFQKRAERASCWK